MNEEKFQFNSAYNMLFSNRVAGIILAYLCHRIKRTHTPFRISDRELSEKLNITTNEIRTAKKYLGYRDFIKMELKGIPATTEYTVDIEKMESRIKYLKKMVY